MRDIWHVYAKILQYSAVLLRRYNGIDSATQISKMPPTMNLHPFLLPVTFIRCMKQTEGVL